MPEETRPDLSFLLIRAYYDLRGMLSDMLAETGLDGSVRPGMGPLLYPLYQEDGCTLSELSKRVGLALSTLHNTLKKMEKDQLVSLKRDPEDRRVVRVHLTPKARELKGEMFALRESVRSVLGAGLDDDQVDQFKDLLLGMIGSMEVRAWETRHPSNRKETAPA